LAFQLIEPVLMMDPAFFADHARQHRLHAEEVLLDVDGDAVVPVFRRHIFPFMALVVSGVVDQHVDIAELCRDLLDRLPQGFGVGEIAFDEQWLGAILGLQDRRPACCCCRH
jgi:hypothetical protein